jgi:hypothetical protein
MRRSFLSFLAVATGAVALMLVSQIPGIGQEALPKGKGAFPGGGQKKAAPPAGPVRRLPDGKPDLQGRWTAQFGNALFSFSTQGTKKGPIVDPPDGVLPYKPEALAKAQELLTTKMYLEPEAHCYMSGVPHQNYVQFGFQIVQNPTYLVMLWEFMHSYRIIPTDNRPHAVPKDAKLFNGDSVGHWEGDVLVVDVTNQTGKTWYDLAGNFQSDKVHVVERFIPVDENTVNYEATIEDPEIYTRPIKIAGVFRRAPVPEELMEFGCIEGNDDLNHYTKEQGGKKEKVR